MKFDNWRDIVKHYEKEEERVYAEFREEVAPLKPVKKDAESYMEHGKKVDLYFEQKSIYDEKRKDTRTKINDIQKEMEGKLFKFFKVDIEKPQIKEAWRMAWDKHGSGYIPVIEFFEELLDLINMKD